MQSEDDGGDLALFCQHIGRDIAKSHAITGSQILNKNLIPKYFVFNEKNPSFAF